MPKFEKKAVIEKIKTRLALNGEKQEISDRTISDALENLMAFAGEEMELDAFVAQVSPAFISMNGNLRHEVAEKVKAIPPVTPPAVPPVTPPTPPNLDEPEWAKTLRLKMEAQELKEVALAKKQAAEAKIAAARELLKTQGATDDTVLKYTLKGLDVSEDQTAEQIAAAVLPQYNKDFKELKGDGATPANPTQNLSATAALEAQTAAKEAVRKIVEKTGINVPEKTQV